MALGLMELMVLGMMVTTLLITLPTLIDIARQPASAWKEAHQLQIIWLAIVFVLPFLGSVAYWTMVRRDLTRAQSAPAMAVAG